MALKIGLADVDNIMLGDSQVDALMLGDQEVWSAVKGNRLFGCGSYSRPYMYEFSASSLQIINTVKNLQYYCIGGMKKRLFASVRFTSAHELNQDTFSVINSVVDKLKSGPIGGNNTQLCMMDRAGQSYPDMYVTNPDTFAFISPRYSFGYAYGYSIDGLYDDFIYAGTKSADDDGSLSVSIFTGLDVLNIKFLKRIYATSWENAYMPVAGANNSMFSIEWGKNTQNLSEMNPDNWGVIRSVSHSLGIVQDIGGTK